MVNEISKTLKIGPDHHLTAEVVSEFARNSKIKVTLSPIAKTKLEQSRGVIEKIIRDKKVVYGVNTGFGPFKNKPRDRILINPDREVGTNEHNTAESLSRP